MGKSWKIRLQMISNDYKWKFIAGKTNEMGEIPCYLCLITGG